MPEDLPDSSPPTEGNVDPAQPAAKSDTGSQEDLTCDSDSTLIGQGAAKRKRHQFDRVEVTPRTLPLDIGDYRLVRKIGEGGMGVVFEAEQKSLGNRKLAIKTIKYLGSFSSGALKRFQNEVQAVAQLEHEHIVPVYHVGEESGLHFYVMKLIDGEDLRQLVNTLKVAVSQTRRGGSTRKQSGSSKAAVDDSTHRSTWSNRDTLASKDVIEKVSEMGSIAHPDFVRQFVRMGIQVATALHHVHENGIVHRDVKPANLILDVNGDVWLTDFGLARIRDSPALTSPGDLIGTYQYMSPEQAMGSRRVIVDHRSDIYSLGVTLYELLTLRRAFPGRTREEILQAVQFEEPVSVRKISSRVPADLETIVMKAMAKNPNTRFQSASEMAAELQRFQDGKPLTIRPPSVLERFGYWARTHRQLVASLAAVCVVAFIAAITVAIVSVNEKAKTQQALEARTLEFERSEGGRLSANSLLQLDTDPTLALLLGVEAAKHYPGSDANDAISKALDRGREFKVLKGHKAPVGHVSFSHDGSKLVSSATSATFSQPKSNDDREASINEPSINEPAIIWDASTGEVLGKLLSDTTITSAVFVPGKNQVLAASSPEDDWNTKEIDESRTGAPPTLWDAETHQIVKTFDDAILSKVHPRVISPGGDMIVLPSKKNENEAVIYRTSDEGDLSSFTLTGHQSRVEFAAFSLDGARVVTYSNDDSARIWDSATGITVCSIEVSSDLTWIEFSPDGRRLGTGSRRGGIKLWDLSNEGGEELNLERVPGKRGLFLRNRNLLATYGSNDERVMNSVAIRSARDASWLFDIPINNYVSNVVASPSGRYFAVLHANALSTLQVWDFQRREMLAVLRCGPRPINDVAFSPDSTLIATASGDMSLRLWHIENGRERATYSAARETVNPIAVASPDGSTLSVAGDDHLLGTVCDFSQAKRKIQFDGKIIMPSAGGSRFLAVGNGRLAVHAMEDGRFLDLETLLPGDSMASAINRDGSRVAATVAGSEVMLWLPDTDRRILLPIGNTPVSDLLFSPDGGQLFALSSDGRIRVWDAEDGSPIKILEHDGRLRDFRFSRNAKMFAVTGYDGSTTLYNAQNLEEIRRFKNPDASDSRARFSFDDKRLITFRTTFSKLISVWDIDSGRLLAELEKLGSLSVDPSPTRPEMLIWSETEGTEIWRYEDDEHLPVNDVRTSAGAYSMDGESFFLSTSTPRDYDAQDIEQWPEETSVPKVTQWDRESLTSGASIEFDAEDVRRIQISDQGGVFVNSRRSRQVVNYDIESHEPVSTIVGHNGPISQCLYTSNSKRLITTSWDTHVSIWDIANGNRLSDWDDHRSPVLSAAISSDDKFLVTGARDGTVRIWDLRQSTDERPVSDSVQVSSLGIRHLAFDSNATRVLAISAEGGVHLYERDSGAAILLEFNSKLAEWAEFSTDGETLLVIPRTEDGTLANAVLIVPINGDPVTRHEYPGTVRTSHFGPESKRIVTTFVSNSKGPDGQDRDLVEVWIQDAESGQKANSFIHEATTDPSADFDPSGEYVYVSTYGAMTIWRVSDGRRWLTVEDIPSRSPWHHSQAPFTPGTPRRVITRRFDTYQHRESPLIPLEATKDQLPRALTEAESRRFLTQE